MFTRSEYEELRNKPQVNFEDLGALKAENERLTAWLRWIAVDDKDAQAALRGEPARTSDNT